MPVNNELYGSFKTFKIGGQYVIVEKANRGNEMEVATPNVLQGTPKTRIMDIGGITENIGLSGPIYVGGAAQYDVRSLMNQQIVKILDRTNTTLPILTKANIRIDSESKANIDISLMSDAAYLINPDPLVADVFNVRDEDGDVAFGAALDSTVNPSRTARNYDFRVYLAGHSAYVQEASINVEVETEKSYFLGQIQNGSAAGDASVDLVNNFGTQLPWIGVKSIKVKGSGKAAVLLTPANNANNHSAINLSTDVTAQAPGLVQLGPTIKEATDTNRRSFALETFQYTGTPTYDATGNETYGGTGAGGKWVPLFIDSTGKELLNLSSAIVSGSNFQVSTGLLTVDFEFTCYVK